MKPTTLYDMNLINPLNIFTAALAMTLVACGGPKDVEVGPYTVSVIEDNVYHIQDYNSANPAGESFEPSSPSGPQASP